MQPCEHKSLVSKTFEKCTNSKKSHSSVKICQRYFKTKFLNIKFLMFLTVYSHRSANSKPSVPTLFYQLSRTQTKSGDVSDTPLDRIV